jgi:hypothetical protein
LVVVAVLLLPGTQAGGVYPCLTAPIALCAPVQMLVPFSGSAGPVTVGGHAGIVGGGVEVFACADVGAVDACNHLICLPIPASADVAGVRAGVRVDICAP